MLVVNGVKLCELDQVHQVWKLKGGHALRFKQHGKSRDKIVDVWHVCQYIVGSGEVSLAALGQ